MKHVAGGNLNNTSQPALASNTELASNTSKEHMTLREPHNILKLPTEKGTEEKVFTEIFDKEMLAAYHGVVDNDTTSAKNVDTDNRKYDAKDRKRQIWWISWECKKV